jgi:hypothetical protein
MELATSRSIFRRLGMHVSRALLVGVLVVGAAFCACGDVGGYAPSDRDSCVPCRERRPAADCPSENCCRYLSDDPYEATAPELEARYEACYRREKPLPLE